MQDAPPIDLAQLERTIYRRWVAVFLVSITPLVVVGAFHMANIEARPSQVDGLLVIFPIVTAVPLLLAILGTRRSMRRLMGEATVWIRDDRAPTSAEIELLVELPLRMSRTPVVFWVVAMAAWICMSVLLTNFGVWRSLVAMLGPASSLGVNVGLGYLTTEDALRPVFGRVLSAREAGHGRTLGVTSRLRVYWAAGSASYLFGIFAIVIAFAVPVVRFAGAICCVLGIGVGFLMTTLAARSVTQPLDKVMRGMERIGQGDLDAAVAVDDPGELGQLQAGFNAMAAGLRERERLRDVFGRYVGAEVADLALAAPELEGSQREVSIMFVDVVGSTRIAEHSEPQAAVEMLNALFAAVVDSVSAEGGFVNQFQGDGALCLFGAPVPTDDHAACALRAARTLRARINGLRSALPLLDAAIGVSTGDVVAGNIGTRDRYAYTAIGDAVNEASRLCDEAKSRVGRLLVSARTVDAAGSSNGWMPAGEIVLRGRSGPTAVCEPTVAAPS